MIGNVVWYTGTPGNPDLFYSKASAYYGFERSNNNGKKCSSSNTCNDSVTRTTKWTGKVGLMYPSDYGYATNGSDDISREECLEKYINSYSNFKCSEKNWLNLSKSMHTISPTMSSESPTPSWAVYVSSISSGRLWDVKAMYDYQVHPTLYLNSNVKITGGDGSEGSPFQLSLD